MRENPYPSSVFQDFLQRHSLASAQVLMFDWDETMDDNVCKAEKMPAVLVGPFQKTHNVQISAFLPDT